MNAARHRRKGNRAERAIVALNEVLPLNASRSRARPAVPSSATSTLKLAVQMAAAIEHGKAQQQ
jgi:hypothetical protein